MLNDLGVKLTKTDMTNIFNSYFDISQNGTISPEEFCNAITLTDHEIDLVVEKIRVKLLSPALASKLYN
jgi:hypothetical protein